VASDFGLLVGAVVLAWVLWSEVRHALAVRKWEGFVERLLDRVQAQSPGVLGELTSREALKREIQRNFRRPGSEPMPEGNLPEDFDEAVARVAEINRLRAEAEPGESTYL